MFNFKKIRRAVLSFRKTVLFRKLVVKEMIVKFQTIRVDKKRESCYRLINLKPINYSINFRKY